MESELDEGQEWTPGTKNRRETEWLPWNQKQRRQKRSHGAGKGRCKSSFTAPATPQTIANLVGNGKRLH